VPVPVEDLPTDGGILVAAPARLRRLLTFMRARVPRPQRGATIRSWALRERRAGAAYLGALAERLRNRGHLRWLADVVARAEATGQHDPRLTTARAVLAYQAGDFGQAIVLARSVTGDAAIGAAGLLAGWLAGAGEIAAARVAYAAADTPPDGLRQALASRATPLPSLPAPNLGRVRSLMAAGAVEDAFRTTRAALRNNPADADLLLALARLWGARGARPQGKAALRAALAADRTGDVTETLLGLASHASASTLDPPIAEPAAPRRKAARSRAA
jgi:tetratricopeptide (TPR) repeat protein